LILGRDFERVYYNLEIYRLLVDLVVIDAKFGKWITV
jgi:hypothetical protein